MSVVWVGQRAARRSGPDVPPGGQPWVGGRSGDASDTVGDGERPERCTLSTGHGVGPGDLRFDGGLLGDLPLAGDWDGNAADTIGVLRRSTGRFFLHPSNSAGPSDRAITLGVVIDGLEP